MTHIKDKQKTLLSVMCLSRQFDCASRLAGLSGQQHIHYLQVVLSNQAM